MTVRVSSEVTVVDQTDATALVTFYQLSSSATKPSKPSTTNASVTPSGWSKTEPSFDPSQGTRYLYTSLQLVWGDGTCSWGDVQLSSSYEQAKAAWNAANAASSAAASAQSSIDNLQVGGRNLLVNTGNYNTWDASSTTAPVTKADGYIKFTPPASAQWLTIEPHSAYIPIADWDASGTYTVSVDVKFDNLKLADSRYPAVALSAVTSNTRIGYAARVYERSIGIIPTTNDWTHFEYTVSGDYTTWTNVTSGTPAYIKVYIWLYLNSSNADAVSFRRLKLEKGNKATDWTPAPEDLASASDSIEYIEGTQTGATGAWTGSTKDSALYAGKSIAYKLPYAGSGNATLSLVLGSVDIPSAWTDDATGSDVTGVNLLKNSATMSVGTSSWANGVWRVAGGTTGMTRSRVQITDGPNGSCYGVQGVGIQTLTTDATCWGIDSMPRTANGIYTFSFYARVVGGGVAQAGWNVTNAIKMIDTNATETFGTALYWMKTLDSSGAWTRVWVTVCPTTAAANIYIGVVAADTTSKTVQICNVKIEKLPTAIAPVYLGTTRMTTHFGAGSIIQMTYDGANWRATSIPNTNNIDRRLHNNAVYAVSNITSSRLICGTEAGYRDVASAATFDLSYPILYASAAITATNTATNTYEALPSVNFSTTGTIEGGAAYKQLYLKGTVSGNIFTVAASPFLTTVQPTTANGYFYIPIGVMASATNGYFATSKDLYAYTDGAFRQVNPATIVATQKIYYRSNAESSGTGVKPNGNGLPTTWVTNTSDTFNTTATNVSGWSTKVSPLTNDGVTGSTKYLYLWTCEQRKRLDGTVAYTDIVLDENTTVIDGGRIITNSITANKLNASSINASKTLTVGALTDAAAETILNSNVVVGGRNLLFKTADFSESGTSTSYFIEYTIGNEKLKNSVTLEEGVEYTFSADIASSIEPFMLSIGAGNGAFSRDVATASNLTSGRVSITFTPTAAQLASGNVFAFRAPRYGAQGTSFTYSVSFPKLEKGNKATDWTPAPEDIDANAIKRTQRIWYRKSATGAPATPGTASSNWVTKADDGNDAWTKMHIAISSTHKYIYTCEQYEMANGTVGYTSVLLDNTITVIDGGNIITGTVTANKLNASDINASKSLTVGAMTDAAASTILNSNVQVGGRNLLQKSAASAENLPLVCGLSASAFVTEDGHPCYKASGGSTAGMFYGKGNALAPTLEANTTYIYSSWIKVTTTASGVTSVAHTFTSLGHHQVYNANSTASDKAHEEIASKRVYTPSTVSIGEWTYITEQFTTNNLPGSLFGKYAKHALGTDYTVYVRDMKLEKGNKATDWTPAPEDVDADISKAAQTATNFLTTVDSTGLFVHRASDASVSSGNGVKITSDVDIIRNGESVANYGEETRIGPEDERHVLITSDEFEFKDGNDIKAMLVAPTSGVEDVMLQLNVGPKDSDGYATDYILRHGGQYSSSDGVGSSYIQASYSSGNISNLAGVFALVSSNISQVQFIGNDITAVSNGHIYNASLDNLGFLLSTRILLAGGDITLPANSGASATWPWQGPVIAGSSGQTAASFPNTNYIVVIGKSGNGQINGFDKVDFMVTGKTESQVTIAGWNSYSQAVTIHVVCIGFNSRYGSRA